MFLVHLFLYKYQQSVTKYFIVIFELEIHFITNMSSIFLWSDFKFSVFESGMQNFPLTSYLIQ